MKYEIIGDNMQQLKVDLNSGEKVLADAGKLISKRAIKMTPRLEGGIIGALVREAGGTSSFLTEYAATEGGPGTVSLGSVLPGKIYQIDLPAGGDFITEAQAFIACEPTVTISLKVPKPTAAFLGGAGIVLQKLVGPGTAFIEVVGDIVQYQIDPSHPLEIDPGHIAGFDSNLKYSVTFVDNIRSMMFGGVGVFLAKFEGTGKVIAHSVSRYTLASTLAQLAAQQKK